MKKYQLLLCALWMVASTAFAGFSTVQKANGQSVLNVSFVQMSHYVNLTPVDVKSGMYTMTIKDVSPYVTYFSDRPTRVVGQMTLDNFLAKWKEGTDNFGKDTPNAILSGGAKFAPGKHRPVNVVLELITPTYNANQHVLSYRVHVLQGLGEQTNPKLEVHNATLIIDNACLSC